MQCLENKIDALKAKIHTIENANGIAYIGKDNVVTAIEPKNKKAFKDFLKAEKNVLEAELIGLETALEMRGK